MGPVPEVKISLDRPGIGPESSLRVVVQEPLRGLSGVRVELAQEEKSEMLVEVRHEPLSPLQFWGPRQAREELVVVVGSRTQKWLAEGEATIRVTAERAPAWVVRPGPTIRDKTVPVRLRPPRVEVLSTQVNVTKGGAEAVVYRVGENAVRDGVQAGAWFFPGFPLPGREG